MKVFLLVGILAIILLSQTEAFSEEFSVTTSKEVYFYGEYLSFTVEVPQVTKEIAEFRIIDQEGVGSSSIDMVVTGKTTVLTAPNPFASYIFKVGTYTLEIEYDGKITTTQFELEDSGKIIIPFWIKDVTTLWTEHVIDDNSFFKNLVDNQVVLLESPIVEGTQVIIPSWFKTNAQLWQDGFITDDEFANGIQYLISIKAVIIGDQ